MVIGIETFKEYFKNYQDCYLVIGGTACDIILEDAGFTPRATDDIDMILIVEAMTPEFVARFWEFVRAADYKVQQKDNDKKNSYRFMNPTNENFPKQIELFSRIPDAIDLEYTAHLTPIPVDEGLSGLSAILLDDNYYEFAIKNSEQKEGIHFALPQTLICLKAFAYLSNKARKEAGQHVRQVEILMHKYDVFRLTMMLNDDDVFELPEVIKVDLQKFADDIKNDLPNPDIFKYNGFGTQNMKAVFVLFLKVFGLG